MLYEIRTLHVDFLIKISFERETRYVFKPLKRESGFYLFYYLGTNAVEGTALHFRSITFKCLKQLL